MTAEFESRQDVITECVRMPSKTSMTAEFECRQDVITECVRMPSKKSMYTFTESSRKQQN